MGAVYKKYPVAKAPVEKRPMLQKPMVQKVLEAKPLAQQVLQKYPLQKYPDTNFELYTGFETLQSIRNAKRNIQNKSSRDYFRAMTNWSPYTRDTSSYLVNYNDPYESNSFVDVIQQALTGTGPNIISGSIDLINRTIVKPVAAGEPSIAFINLLMNVDETLNLLSNPVKAVVISAAKGEDVTQAFLDSIGVGGQGRKNYNFETGNLLVDIVLEVVADPGTWMTFGVLGAGKGFIKGGVRMTETGAKKLVLRLADDISQTAVTDLFNAIGKDGQQRLLQSFNEKMNTNMSINEIRNAIKLELKRIIKKIDKSVYERILAQTRANAARHGTKMDVEKAGKINLRNIEDVARENLSKQLLQQISSSKASAGFDLIKTNLATIAAKSIDAGTYKTINSIINGQVELYNQGILKGLFGTLRVLEQASDLLVKYGTFGIATGIGKIFTVLANTKSVNRLMNSTIQNVNRIFKSPAANTITLEDLNNQLIQEWNMFPELALEYGPEGKAYVLLLTHIVALQQLFLNVRDIVNTDFNKVSLDVMLEKINALFPKVAKDVTNIDEFIDYLVKLDEFYKNQVNITYTGLEETIKKAKFLKEYIEQINLVKSNENDLKGLELSVKSLKRQLDGHEKSEEIFEQQIALNEEIYPKLYTKLEEAITETHNIKKDYENKINEINKELQEYDEFIKRSTTEEEIKSYTVAKESLEQEKFWLQKELDDIQEILAKREETITENKIPENIDKDKYHLNLIIVSELKNLMNEPAFIDMSSIGWFIEGLKDDERYGYFYELFKNIWYEQPAYNTSKQAIQAFKKEIKLLQNYFEIYREFEYGDPKTMVLLKAGIINLDKADVVQQQLTRAERKYSVLQDNVDRLKEMSDEWLKYEHLGIFDEESLRVASVFDNIWRGKMYEKPTKEAIKVTFEKQAEEFNVLLKQVIDVLELPTELRASAIRYLKDKGKNVIKASNVVKQSEDAIIKEKKEELRKINKALKDLQRNLDPKSSEYFTHDVPVSDLRKKYPEKSFQVTIKIIMRNIKRLKQDIKVLSDTLNKTYNKEKRKRLKRRIRQKQRELHNLQNTYLRAFEKYHLDKPESFQKDLEWFNKLKIKKEKLEKDIQYLTSAPKKSPKDIGRKPTLLEKEVEAIKEQSLEYHYFGDLIDVYLDTEQEYSFGWYLAQLKNEIEYFTQLQKEGIENLTPETVMQLENSASTIYELMQNTKNAYNKFLAEQRNIRIHTYEDAQGIDFKGNPYYGAGVQWKAGRGTKEYNKLEETIDDMLENIDTLIAKQAFINLSVSDIFYVLKLDNIYTLLKITNDESFANIRNDPGLGQFCNENVLKAVISNDTVYTKFKEILAAKLRQPIEEVEGIAEQFIINCTIIAKAYQDKARLNTLMNTIDKSKVLSPKAKQGFISALYYHKDSKLNDIDINTLIKQLHKSINKFTTTSSSLFKRSKLDNAFEHTFNAEEQIVVERQITDDIKRIVQSDDKKILDLYKRHSSLYDTLKTAYVYKKLHPNDYQNKCFIDTETTGVLDPFEKAHGRLREITVLKFDENGVIQPIFNRHVQVSEEDYNSNYGLFSSTLLGMLELDDSALSKAIKEDKQKYITTDSTLIYTEEDLLRDLADATADLDSTINIVGYKNSDFDMIYLDNRFDQYKMDKRSAPLLQNQVEDLLLEMQQKLGLKDLELTDEELIEIQNIITDYYTNSVKIADEFNNTVGDFSNKAFEFRLIDGINQSTRTALNNIIDMINVKPQGLSVKKVKLIPQGVIDDAIKSSDVIEERANPFEEALQELFEDPIITQAKSDLIKQSFITGSDQNAFLTAQDSINRELIDIKAMNNWFLENPISASNLEENAEAYLEKILQGLGIKKGTPEYEQYMGMEYSNFSQLLYGIKEDKYPLVGYNKIVVPNMKTILNITDDTKVVTVRHARDLHNKYVKPIAELANYTWNLRPLYDLKINGKTGVEMVHEVLEQWSKSATVFSDLKYIKVDSGLIAQDVATLEVFYNRLKNILSAPSFEHPNADKMRKLVADFEKNYPELLNILDNSPVGVHAKTYMNTDIPRVLAKDVSELELPRPDQTTIEVVDEAIQIQHFNNVTRTEYEMFQQINQQAFNQSIYEKGTDIFNATTALQSFMSRIYDVKNPAHKHQKTLTRLFAQVFDVFNIAETMQVLTLEPVAFRDMLIEFGGPYHSISLGRAVTTNKYSLDLVGAQRSFLHPENLKQLEELGVKVVLKKDPKTNTRTIVACLDNKMYKGRITRNRASRGALYCLDGDPIQRVELKELDQEVFYKLLEHLPETEGTATELLKLIMNYRQKLLQIDPTLSGRSMYVSSIDSYDIFAKDYLASFSDSFQRQATDPAAQKVIKELREFMNDQKIFDNYKSRSDGLYHTNTYVLGDSLDRGESIRGLTSNPMGSITLLTNRLGHHIRAQEAFTQMMLNGSPTIDTIFEGRTNAEIKALLENDDRVVLVYLRDDPAYVNGYALDRVTVYNDKTLNKARELDARVISYSDYEIYAEHINNYDYNRSAFLKVWHNLIVMYKKGYLLSLGTILRNALDAGIKMVSNGEDPGESMKSLINGYQLMSKFEHDMDAIRKMDPQNVFRRTNMEQYFFYKDIYKPALEEDQYKMIYDFTLINGASSITNADQSLFGRFMKKGMGRIEDSTRLAQYLNLKNQGEDYDRIIKSITDTHFNYNVKSKTELMMELYIPFYSFTVRNLVYFTQEMLNKPELLRIILNMYTPIWDFDSRDYYELSHNASLQYQIIAGNVPIGDNGLTLKIGLSILDSLNLMVTPLSNIHNKLAPPVELLVNSFLENAAQNLSNVETGDAILSFVENNEEYAGNFRGTSVKDLITNPSEVADLIPVLGPIIQRNLGTALTGFERTGNPLNLIAPSIFGSTKHWQPYTPKDYSSSRVKRTKWKNYKSSYRPKVYVPRAYTPYYRKSYINYGTKAIYNFPYNEFTRFVHRVSHPNFEHRHSKSYYEYRNRFKYNAFKTKWSAYHRNVTNLLLKNL